MSCGASSGIRDMTEGPADGVGWSSETGGAETDGS
ncbi:Uncharacterised protein [Flavonifractor plautii]|uniref:Uncharacterized protein n=1 Tax=Flavonifractor plautii TaxID=292800 RepID=A0A174QVQ6_FLAPL|nr:Uncharacterised protein [Flavonifractor plautii]